MVAEQPTRREGREDRSEGRRPRPLPVFQMAEVAVPWSCFGASSIASAGCDRRTGPMLTLDGRVQGIGGRGAHTPQTSLRTSSIVKPRKVSLTAFPRPAMMSAIFATVSSSGASVIAIWSY